MKTNSGRTLLFFVTFIFCGYSLFSQKNKSKPLDSALEANSEKWKVKPRKMFGMAKPEIGPYTTSEIEKLDSPVFRKRTKDGSYSGTTISSDGWDWDFSKYETVEKKKVYRMLVATDADTVELLFSVYRVSKEKNLTFFGEMMSKNDEGKNMTLGYKTNVSGIIATGIDSLPCRFFIEDASIRNEEAMNLSPISITRWYIITGDDSLFTEPIMSKTGSPKDKYFLEWQRGVFVNNASGNRIAALKFDAQSVGNLSDPSYAWIRNDLKSSQKQAIASLFALMIVIITYSG